MSEFMKQLDEKIELEKKEKRREWFKNYHIANKEKHNEYARQYRKAKKNKLQNLLDKMDKLTENIKTLGELGLIPIKSIQ